MKFLHQRYLRFDTKAMRKISVQKLNEQMNKTERSNISKATEGGISLMELKFREGGGGRVRC